MPFRPRLFVEDIADLWTEERRKVELSAPEVGPRFVNDYHRWSFPTPAGNKRTHRFENDPMPYPRASRGPNQPSWDLDQEEDLRRWYRKRLGLLRITKNTPADEQKAIETELAAEEKRVAARIAEYAAHITAAVG